MSRSSRPTSWCSRAPVDLCAVAASALEQFAPAAEQKGIRLALESGNEWGWRSGLIRIVWTRYS